jgi:hypothetical protein
MKIKRLSRLSLACLFSLSSVLMVVVPPAHAIPINCTWDYTGGGNSNFSFAGNWQNCNGGAPTGAGNEELVFPITPGVILNANNDLSGASFMDITFTGGSGDNQNYVITGNPMSVGDITDQSSTLNGNELALDLSLIGSSQVTFTGSSSSRLIIGDPNSIGTNSLDLASSNPFQVTDTTIASSIIGSGTLNASSPSGDSGVDLLASSPGFTGTINANSSTLFLDNINSSASVTVSSGSILKGDNGSASSINIASGGIIAPGHSPGCLTAGSQLVINGTYQEEIAGTSPCTDYDQVTSGGSTDITGSTLDVSFLNSFQPTVGNSFIVIKNTGGGSVTGTFAGLPEGGSFKVGNATFAITYQGNGENDVVITVTKVDVASGTSNTPNAPNTGLALMLAHPFAAFGIPTMAALFIALVGRRVNTAKR